MNEAEAFPMKYMVEVQLKPGTRNKAVEAFDERGPNRNPGVTFVAAWIGSHSDVAFVLVDAEDESRVAKTAASWPDFGDAKIHAVVDVQQY
jgi:hypothetical protein